MQPPITIVAEMADGSTIVEHVTTFAAFVAIVLPFRHDAECVCVTWHETGAAALDDPWLEPEIDDSYPGVDPWTGEYMFEVA